MKFQDIFSIAWNYMNNVPTYCKIPAVEYEF